MNHCHWGGREKSETPAKTNFFSVEQRKIERRENKIEIGEKKKVSQKEGNILFPTFFPPFRYF